LKHILTILLITSTLLPKQETSLNNWIQSFVKDMKEMNDLEKYSSKPISPAVDINFLLVESVKDITVNKDSFTLLVNHGNGTYCTQLTFKYTSIDGQYYLIFSEVHKKVILSRENLFINPWTEKINICN
jgi:hypothetical protein